MSALVLSNQFNLEIFNNLPHYNEAKLSVSSSEGLIYQNFSPLIKKYGLSDLVSLCLLHKHFDLKDGEVLLENMNGVESVISPQKSSTCVPYMWKAGRNAFVPLEFVEYSPEIAVKVEKVETASAFLQEFFQLLVELKVSILNIFVLYQIFFSMLLKLVG